MSLFRTMTVRQYVNNKAKRSLMWAAITFPILWLILQDRTGALALVILFVALDMWHLARDLADKSDEAYPLETVDSGH